MYLASKFLLYLDNLGAICQSIGYVRVKFKFDGGEREQKRKVYEISRASLFYIYYISTVFNLSSIVKHTIQKRLSM